MILNQSTCIEIHSQNNENDSIYSSGITSVNEIETYPNHHRNSCDTTISSSSSINTSYSSATTPRTLRNSLSHFTSTSTNKHTSLNKISTHPPLPNFNPIPQQTLYYYHHYHNNQSISTLTLSSDLNIQKKKNRHQINQWWGNQKQKWKQFRHKKEILII